MKFRIMHQKTPSGAYSPIHVVEQSTGQGVAWINRFLDREYVRRLADKTLYTQHVMEMFRRSLPIGNERSRLDRLQQF
jgi:hypothetical protein